MAEASFCTNILIQPKLIQTLPALSTFWWSWKNELEGWKNGWMALFEQLVGLPLGRVIFLCHQAQLPYRAPFHALDSKTSGPATCTGPIGNCIAGAVHAVTVAMFPTVA